MASEFVQKRLKTKKKHLAPGLKAERRTELRRHRAGAPSNSSPLAEAPAGAAASKARQGSGEAEEIARTNRERELAFERRLDSYGFRKQNGNLPPLMDAVNGRDSHDLTSGAVEPAGNGANGGKLLPGLSDAKVFQPSDDAKHLTHASRAKLHYDVVDQAIIAASPCYPGIPTPQSLSKETGGPLPYSAGSITKRAVDNPEVQTAIENAGIAYALTCSVQEFAAGLMGPRWWRSSEPVIRAMEWRVDIDLLKAVIESSGFPDPPNLIEGESALPYCISLVRERFRDSQFLRPALVKHGVDYFSKCSSEELTANLGRELPAEVRHEINKRLDREIFAALRPFVGVPSASDLTKSGGGSLIYPEYVINNRFKTRFWLQRAREIVATRFIRTCNCEVFNEIVATRNLYYISSSVQSEIEKRLDESILEEIVRSKGVPDHKNLSEENGGPLPYAPTTIYSRIHSNASLRDAIESRTAPDGGPVQPNPQATIANELPEWAAPGPKLYAPAAPRSSVSEIVRRLRQP